MKFKMTFKKGLLIYAVVALVLIFIGLFVFWGFISDYEDSMPIHGMDEVVDKFEANNIDDYLVDAIEGAYNEFETESDVNKMILDEYKKFINGKEISFVKAKEYTDKAPQYIVSAGDTKVARVSLSAKTKNDSDFDVWTFDSINISEYLVNIIETKDYTVTVPEGTVVTVNGKEISDTYLVKSEDIKELEEAGKYVTVPKMNTYEIKGFYNAPEIKGSYNGKAVSLKAEENKYSGSFCVDEEFAKEQGEYVDKVVTLYAKNFINVDKNIYSYVMKKSYLYESMQSATTYFYPDSSIQSYEFTEKTIGNYVVYNENCFSVDVKYTLFIDFKPSYKQDNTTEIGNFKFYFVKQDDKWYLTSLSYN